MFRYFKRKIVLFIALIGASLLGFFTLGHTKARENAYVACLIDDESFMYKTQVLYSGLEIEAGRFSTLNNMNVYVEDANNLIDVSRYSFVSATPFSDSFTSLEGSIDKDTGKVTIYVYTDGKCLDGREISSEDWAKAYNLSVHTVEETEGEDGNSSGMFEELVEEGNKNLSNISSTPLTFPNNFNSSAGEADINRAYAVSETLGEDFRNALLFVNDGKSFTSVDALIDTAYALVSSSGVMINQYGTKYRVSYSGGSSDYSYLCHITRVSSRYEKNGLVDDDDREMDFIYAVKKGYKNCSADDYFEDGTKNNLNPQKAAEKDTTYVTWQQLFLEAGVLYAEGISYSNCADLYELEDFEDSLLKVARNFLSGIQNKLQLYSIEDCLLNNAIRGSKSFVYGIYRKGYETRIFQFFLVFLAISLSLVVMSLVVMIMKKQWAIASPMSRFSLMQGLRDLVFVVLVLGFLWKAMQFVFLCNYKFVNVGRALAGGNTLAPTGGYSSLSALLYTFVFFIIKTYVNVVYVLRGLIVPVLMFVGPLSVFVFSFGGVGKKVTLVWLKEFLGNVFIQTFHSLAYAFMLSCSGGLRGIESLVVYASIIPITSVIRQITGLGGDELLRKGRSLTTSIGSTIGAGAQAAASIEGANVQAEAMKKAANTQAISSAVGAGVGGALSFAGPVGMAAGGLVSAGANAFGGYKAAEIVAQGTKEAAKISGGGAMLNAAMGAGLSAVLDSGDGQIQSGVSHAADSQRRASEAEGRMYLQQADALSGGARQIEHTAGRYASAKRFVEMTQKTGGTDFGNTTTESSIPRPSFDSKQRSLIRRGFDPDPSFGGRSNVEIKKDGGKTSGYREFFNNIESANQIKNAGISPRDCYNSLKSAYEAKDKSVLKEFSASKGVSEAGVVASALTYANKNSADKKPLSFFSNGGALSVEGGSLINDKTFASRPSPSSAVDRAKKNFESS